MKKLFLAVLLFIYASLPFLAFAQTEADFAVIPGGDSSSSAAASAVTAV